MLKAVINKTKLFEAINYVPHSSGQWSYHNSTARFRLPVCGRRFGKSTMAAKDKEPSMLNPTLKERGWIVGPTYDLGEKEFRVLWTDLIINKKFGRDPRVKKAYRKNTGEMYIEMPWGTRVEVRSATHPESLVGEALHWVIMSEAAKHDKETFERYIRPALSDYRGTADFPTTPEGFNWLYDMWLLGQNPDFPDFESWRFPSWDNPIVYPGGRQDPEILLIETTTAKEWFKQEYGAEFSTFVGRIFDEFDEQIHVKKHIFRPDWPNYMTIDWGFTHPLAAIEFQVDPMGRVYVWREHVKSFLTVAEHCRQLKDRDQPAGYHLDLAFGDAADPEAAAVVSVNLVGCITDPMAKVNWRQGIDALKVKLKTYPTGAEIDEFGTPEELPHLIVDHGCRTLIHELNMYRAREVNSGVSESGTNSIAIKANDDTVDALRYGIMHVFELGAVRHLHELQSVNVVQKYYGTHENPNETFFVMDRAVSASNGETFFTFTGGKL